MSSKTEDFPTPVSPIRKMVYGAFVLFFDVLMIPCLRDSMSLGNRSAELLRRRCYYHCHLLDSTLATAFPSVLTWACASRTVAGGGSVTGRSTIQVNSHSRLRAPRKDLQLGHYSSSGRSCFVNDAFETSERDRK